MLHLKALVLGFESAQALKFSNGSGFNHGQVADDEAIADFLAPAVKQEGMDTQGRQRRL